MQPATIRLDSTVVQWAFQALSRLFATFAIFQAVNLLVGGEGRFTAPAFDVARQLPGSPESWALLLGLPGVVALAGSVLGRAPWVAAGHGIMSVWSLFFATGFGLAAIPALGGSESASTTGFWAYLCFCIAFAIVSTAYLHSDES